jgi:hypothetical protein
MAPAKYYPYPWLNSIRPRRTTKGTDGVMLIAPAVHLERAAVELRKGEELPEERRGQNDPLSYVCGMSCPISWLSQPRSPLMQLQTDGPTPGKQWVQIQPELCLVTRLVLSNWYETNQSDPPAIRIMNDLPNHCVSRNPPRSYYLTRYHPIVRRKYSGLDRA